MNFKKLGNIPFNKNSSVFKEIFGMSEYFLVGLVIFDIYVYILTAYTIPIN